MSSKRGKVPKRQRRRKRMTWKQLLGYVVTILTTSGGHLAWHHWAEAAPNTAPPPAVMKQEINFGAAVPTEHPEKHKREHKRAEAQPADDDPP